MSDKIKTPKESIPKQLFKCKLTNPDKPVKTPTTVFIKGGYRTIFYAPQNTPITSGVQMIIPLGLEIEVEDLHVLNSYPNYVVNTLNMNCSLINIMNYGVCGLSMEVLTEDWDKSQPTTAEIAYVKEGEPILTICTDIPLIFEYESLIDGIKVYKF